MSTRETNKTVNFVSGEIADELLAIGVADARIKAISRRLRELGAESLRALLDRETFAGLREEYWGLRAERARIKKDRKRREARVSSLQKQIEKIGYDAEQKSIAAATVNQPAEDAGVNKGVIEFTEANDASSESDQ